MGRITFPTLDSIHHMRGFVKSPTTRCSTPQHLVVTRRNTTRTGGHLKSGYGGSGSAGIVDPEPTSAQGPASPHTIPTYSPGRHVGVKNSGDGVPPQIDPPLRLVGGRVYCVERGHTSVSRLVSFVLRFGSENTLWRRVHWHHWGVGGIILAVRERGWMRGTRLSSWRG